MMLLLQHIQEQKARPKNIHEANFNLQQYTYRYINFVSEKRKVKCIKFHVPVFALVFQLKSIRN